MASARMRKATRRPTRKARRRAQPAAAPAPSAPSSVTTSVRLLIADDHPLFLDGLEAFFGTQPDVTIVARCVDGEEALEAIRNLKPDVALLDRLLPTLDAIGIVRRIAPEHLASRIVIFVADADHDVMIEALGLGVRGFLNKSLPSRLIAECVRQIHAGGYWLEKQVTAVAMQKMVLRESGHRRLLQAGLTPRETEIAKLAAQNLRTGDISKRLNISPGTAKLHLHQIYRKLNLSGRLALMLYARENGLV
jgi:two-component system, NarL family, nitrate/nitrite response regulator NarL